MRIIINKRTSTKAERRFIEILKKNHIPFKFRIKLFNKEVDFLIRDKIVIEIGNHKQNLLKNKELIENGYNLITISNRELKNSPMRVEKCLLKTYERL